MATLKVKPVVSYITVDDLRMVPIQKDENATDNNDDNDDFNITNKKQNSKRRKSSQKKSIDTFHTKNAKPLVHSQQSDLYTVNPCPGYPLLKRFTKCRLIDPIHPTMQFWLLQDVTFDQTWTGHLESMGVLLASDIFVWVYEPLPPTSSKNNTVYTTMDELDGVNEQPLKLPGSDGNDTPYIFQIANNVVEDEQLERKYAQGYIVGNSNSVPRYAKSRRTGYLIIRDLHFIENSEISSTNNSNNTNQSKH
jgi:hypothetical protein